MGARVAIIAGEPSGDQLGAELMRRIRALDPEAEIEGVAGPKMRAEGIRPIGDINELSLMGITEVLRHVPRLIKLRRELVRYLVEDDPDVVIGIDSPDFNLELERRVRKAGIATIHYVSPTVWAWRPGRIHKVLRAADQVFCLFPFEPELYREAGGNALFAGHPLAREITGPGNRAAARKELDLPRSGLTVALLPGSRVSEVARLAPIFLQAAVEIHRQHPEVSFVIPAADTACEEAIARRPEINQLDLPLRIVHGKARTAMTAADVVLCASGTASLESMLLIRPAVVAYKVHPWTYRFLNMFNLIRTERFAMPNILAGEDLMPEFMQDEARPELLARAVIKMLEHQTGRDRLAARFAALSARLREGDPEQAARAVLRLAARSG